jgi:hypothetical protein
MLVGLQAASNPKKVSTKAIERTYRMSPPSNSVQGETYDLKKGPMQVRLGATLDFFGSSLAQGVLGG